MDADSHLVKAWLRDHVSTSCEYVPWGHGCNRFYKDRLGGALYLGRGDRERRRFLAGSALGGEGERV
jgi:hypothetical protein